MLHKKIRAPERKTIALVVHDHKKDDLSAWIYKNKGLLKNHNLLGAGNIANLFSERTGLKVKAMISGPLGGDQQTGAMISESKVDILIFFWDPLEAMPHDSDTRALFRISILYNIVLATCPTMANYPILSPPYQSPYEAEIVDNGHILNVGHRDKKKS